MGGEIRLDGKPVTVRSPREAIRHGIYLVPEDRKRAGLVLEMPLVENITLASLLSLRADAAGRPGGGDGGVAHRSARACRSGRRATDAGRHAVGRQPAEGGARQMAVDAAAAW